MTNQEIHLKFKNGREHHAFTKPGEWDAQAWIDQNQARIAACNVVSVRIMEVYYPPAMPLTKLLETV